MGPVVSSERTTSRKGLRKMLGSTSDSSEEKERERKRHTTVRHVTTEHDTTDI